MAAPPTSLAADDAGHLDGEVLANGARVHADMRENDRVLDGAVDGAVEAG